MIDPLATEQENAATAKVAPRAKSPGRTKPTAATTGTGGRVPPQEPASGVNVLTNTAGATAPADPAAAQQPSGSPKIRDPKVIEFAVGKGVDPDVLQDDVLYNNAVEQHRLAQLAKLGGNANAQAAPQADPASPPLVTKPKSFFDMTFMEGLKHLWAKSGEKPFGN